MNTGVVLAGQCSGEAAPVDRWKNCFFRTSRKSDDEYNEPRIFVIYSPVVVSDNDAFLPGPEGVVVE